MKLFTFVLLAPVCTTVIDIEGCGKREVKYPCPEESPTPTPIPSPLPSPVTSPSPDPSPEPIPSPSVSPVAPSPVPSISPLPIPGLTESGNYPLPPLGKCDANYAKGTPIRYGAAYLSTVPIKPQGRYIGIRINVSATPFVSKPYCEHSCYNDDGVYNLAFCRNNCELLKACQDPLGTPIYMTLPGKFENDICDEQSHNRWNCHHKPEIGQTGPTTFIPYPRGMAPGSKEAREFCGPSHPSKPGFVNCHGVTIEVK